MTRAGGDNAAFASHAGLNFDYAASLFNVIGEVLNTVNADDRKSVYHVLERAFGVIAAGKALMRAMAEECQQLKAADC